MPGGFGTLDELFEALTLVQTKKVDPVPIILYDSTFWAGMMDWIRNTLWEDFRTISEHDPGLMHVVDTPEEVVEVLDAFYSKSLLRPNF